LVEWEHCIAVVPRATDPVHERPAERQVQTDEFVHTVRLRALHDASSGA
jgi:hypothetical protein